CDGRTPVHSLNGSPETIRALVQRGILLCELEVPALEPHAFGILRADVANWRKGAAREKWLPTLQAIAELPAKFAGTSRSEDRQQISEAAHLHFRSLGIERKPGDRSLYSA